MWYLSPESCYLPDLLEGLFWFKDIQRVVSFVTMAETEDNSPEAKASCLTWLPIKCVLSDQDHPSYPFCSSDSGQDVYFARCLLAYTPFLAPYGSGTQAWINTANKLQQQKDDNGNLIFPKGCKWRALKCRFHDYMLFVQEEYCQSGFDNYPPMTETLGGLEDVYDQYTGHLTTAEESKVAKTK